MRLIDADALLQRAIPHGWSTPKWVSDITINDAPTVDAEPVKRGWWKRSKYYKNIIFCNECGEPYELSNSIEHWNYCPNCGAKMDGGAADETD